MSVLGSGRLAPCRLTLEAFPVLTTSFVWRDRELRLLATSREPLGVPGALERPVPPLCAPAPGR